MTDPHVLESRLRAFDLAWRHGPPPEIAAYLVEFQSAAAEDRLKALLELLCIDLEYRWKRAQHDSVFPAWQLDRYVLQFSELGATADLPLELIEEEYRVRHRWGDRPGHQEYVERFGSRAGDTEAALKRVDAELNAESDDEREDYPPRPASFPFRRPGLDPRAPLKYADYRLERLIGAGRVGKVYQAWQRSLERSVAVKYLRKCFQQDAEVIERFVEEARIVARLRHPGVVGVYGLGCTRGGGYFIAMELVDGPDLMRVMRNGPVAIADAVRWIRAACPAVDHAHQRGIVHCDLKPANLLLDSDGRVRVADFGLARALAIEGAAEPRIAGTAPFMAPEQVTDVWGAIDPRTDVYGLGATLYALLTGQSPWRGSRVADILAQVASAVPADDPRLHREGIPERLSEIVQRCLAKDPGRRYRTAVELESALAAFE